MSTPSRRAAGQAATAVDGRFPYIGGMRVVEIWRYPVKSLQGEHVESADVTPQGLAGDRAYALFDVATGLGLTARRVPELLFASARRESDGSVEITLPDGSVALNDADLSSWLGREVVLRSTAEQVARQYESPADFEDEDGPWESFGAPTGAFHDSSRTNVSLVSTTTLAQWDRRRFRSNLVLDGAGEDDLVGSRIRLGSAELQVQKQVDRCVMTTRPQPGGIAKDLDVLRTIHRLRGGHLAIGATVVTTGTARVGDSLEVVGAPARAR